MLYSNPYSNADEHQRKYRTRNEQNMHISSTKRTQANTSEQHNSSPPFGTLSPEVRIHVIGTINLQPLQGYASNFFLQFYASEKLRQKMALRFPNFQSQIL